MENKEPVVTREEQNEQFSFQRKVRFNGEVTLGHVLTLVSMLALLIGVWRNFEVRMVKLEQIVQFQSSSIAAIILNLEKISDQRGAR